MKKESYFTNDKKLNRYNNPYIKEAVLNGEQVLLAFIDLGSSECLVKASTALKAKCDIKYDDTWVR